MKYFSDIHKTHSIVPFIALFNVFIELYAILCTSSIGTWNLKYIMNRIIKRGHHAHENKLLPPHQNLDFVELCF